MKATVILPAYNEEKNIADVISAVRKTGDYEIIVVDDGSRDRTASVARKLGVVCISLGKNRGKGYACLTGAKLASNRNIIFIDADNQHDASEIPNLLKGLAGNDVVLGKRDFSHVPVQRRLSNAFARKIVSAAAGVKFSDALCGFRGIRKDKFFQLDIRKHRYEFESEMLIKAAKMKMNIKEIPVRVRYGVGSSMPVTESAKVTAYILSELIKR